MFTKAHVGHGQIPQWWGPLAKILGLALLGLLFLVQIPRRGGAAFGGPGATSGGTKGAPEASPE